MADPQKTQKTQMNTTNYSNPLEAIKDIGKNTTETLKQDLFSGMAQSAMDQIFGPKPGANYKAEITAGESVEMTDVYTGQHNEKIILQRQLYYEKHLLQEEERLSRRKADELRVALQAVMQETLSLMQQTEDLAEETKIALMQAPVEPGVYHLLFFEKLLSFIKSFRKKIESASVWMHSANGRAQKKNWVNNYKNHGAKYLLSGEHYVARSAG